jgi:hypothetical protein
VVILAAVVFGYAALPALLSEQVSRAETGIANSVSSVARTMGSALASAVVVALLTRDYIPGLPIALPRAHQSTVVFLIGVGTTLFSALLVAFGLKSPRRHLTWETTTDSLHATAAGASPGRVLRSERLS